MSKFTTEDQIETYNLDLLDALGYGYTHGATLAPDALTPNPSPRGRGASELQSPSPWEGLGEGDSSRARDSSGSYLDTKKRDRKSTRLNSSHIAVSRMPSSA